MTRKLPEHVQDACELSATALREKYTAEYSSWKNMKQREKDGYSVDVFFESFAGFLAMLGPKPGSDFTLDRIDYTDKEYAPGKCELRAKVGDGQAADEISVSRPSAKITPVSILGKRCFASIARQRF